MAERLFGLPHSYPDFPLQQPRSSKSPKSPEIQAPPSLPPYESRDTKMREKLPSPLRGLNQVRFRQFKKQIESIRKLSYDLPKKEGTGKGGQIGGEKGKGRGGGGVEEADREKVGPRGDIHKQLLGLLKVLEGAKGSLNTNFQVVCGDFPDSKPNPPGVCPLCKCSCKSKPQPFYSVLSDPTLTDLHMDHKPFIQECSQCSDRYLTDKSEPDFLCFPCKSGLTASRTPGCVSLLLEVRVEELSAPVRSRTPTPPPLERTVRSPISVRNTGIETDRSPRKRLIISPAKRIAGIYRRSDEIKPNPQSKLVLTLGGVPIRLIPGEQSVRVMIAEGLKEGQRRENGPVVPATPSFHAGPAMFCGTGESETDFQGGEEKGETMDVSFSQNFLTSESPTNDPDVPLYELAKSLHTEIEYVLSDHLQIASKHQYVFEITDVSESYVIQYLNLMRRVWKVMIPYIPEAVSALEMCVKGLVLVLEMAIAAGSKGDSGGKRQMDVGEKMQKVVAELMEERAKSEKLEKSLKNVIRNYEEMISMYTREHQSEIPFPQNHHSSRIDSVSLDD